MAPRRERQQEKLTDLFVTNCKPGGARSTDLRTAAARPGAVGANHRQEGVEGHLSLSWSTALVPSRRRQNDRPGRRTAAHRKDQCRCDRGQRSGGTAQGRTTWTAALPSWLADDVELTAQKAQQELEAGPRTWWRGICCRAGASSRPTPSPAPMRGRRGANHAPILANQTLAAASARLPQGGPPGDPNDQPVPRRRSQEDPGAGTGASDDESRSSNETTLIPR